MVYALSPGLQLHLLLSTACMLLLQGTTSSKHPPTLIAVFLVHDNACHYWQILESLKKSANTTQKCSPLSPATKKGHLYANILQIQRSRPTDSQTNMLNYHYKGMQMIYKTECVCVCVHESERKSVSCCCFFHHLYFLRSIPSYICIFKLIVYLYIHKPHYILYIYTKNMSHIL